MRGMIACVSAVVLLVGMVSTAGAGQITVTGSLVATDSGFAVPVQQFNPALGTLTGVTVDLHLQVTPVVSVINVTSSAATANAFSNSTGWNPINSIQDPGTYTPLKWTDPYGNYGSTDYAYAVSNVTATSGLLFPGYYLKETDFDGPVITPSDLTSLVPADQVSNYVGTGLYDVNYATGGTIHSGIQYLSGGNGTSSSVFGGGGPQYAGTATVTYDYTPEPATLVLLGLGGAATLIRRRKSK